MKRNEKKNEKKSQKQYYCFHTLENCKRATSKQVTNDRKTANKNNICTKYSHIQQLQYRAKRVFNVVAQFGQIMLNCN